MEEIVKSIQGTPIPNLLIISGIVFILLSITGGISGKINITPQKQKAASLFGIVFLIIGLSLIFIPVKGGIDPPKSPSAPVSDPKPPINPDKPWESWNKVVDETFADNAANWPSDSTSTEFINGRASVMDGKYRFDYTFNKSTGALMSNLAPYMPLSNFYFASDFNVVAPRNNAEKGAAAGLYFRWSGTKGYAFILSANAKYSLCSLDDGVWKEIIGWTVIPGLNAYKRIRLAVLADGPFITLYINGVKCAAIEDHANITGNYGLLVEGWSKDSFVVDFDNIAVYEKPDSLKSGLSYQQQVNR